MIAHNHSTSIKIWGNLVQSRFFDRPYNHHTHYNRDLGRSSTGFIYLPDNHHQTSHSRLGEIFDSAFISKHHTLHSTWPSQLKRLNHRLHSRSGEIFDSAFILNSFNHHTFHSRFGEFSTWPSQLTWSQPLHTSIKIWGDLRLGLDNSNGLTIIIAQYNTVTIWLPTSIKAASASSARKDNIDEPSEVRISARSFHPPTFHSNEPRQQERQTQTKYRQTRFALPC